MAVAAQGKLNLNETPEFGSRSVDCFEKLEQIGEGTYGQVFMAKEKETGEVVALKKIRMDNEREGFPITAIREIKILKKLHHENVIKLKEIVTSPGRDKDEHDKSDGNKYTGSIYMVFEYMDHDLTGLSDRPGLQFTVPQIKCYMKQLLTGLHYCHLNQVLHRDIKGSNLLIDNKGNLKLADFGLARSFSSDHSGNLTNRVITLWYRPPELLLGATQYGPAVDMWSVGCIFAELLNGKPILPGKNEAEQLNRIYELCGTPDEVNWPGAFKTPWYNNLKPSRPMRRRVREVFKHFDRHALELLEKMLALDPSQRISAQDALNAEYFWTEPFPCDPKSLPQYESSHEFQTKKKRQQLRQQEENAKRQKFQHPQSHVRLPPVQQSGQAHPQMRQGPSQANQNLQPPVPTGPGHHYGKPQGPPGGANRYPQGGIPSGGYNSNRGGHGGGYSGSSYSQQGRPPPYVGSGMPGNSCPKGGSGMPANSGLRVGGTGMPGNSGPRGGASGMPAISGPRVGGTGMPGNSGPRGGAIGMSTNSGPRAGGTGVPAISGPRVGGTGMPGNSGPRGGASGMPTNSVPRAGGTGMPANSGQRVGGNGMPSNSGPRGGRSGISGSSGPSGGGGGMSGNSGSRGYGAGPQSNFSQGGPYGAPAAGRGPNMMAGNRNQHQQPQQQQQQYGVWP